MRRFVCAALVFALFAPSAAIAASSVPSSLSWRNIGPFRGGRAIAVAGVPSEPNHFYFGSVNGGVWETNNAGRTWNPIFDSQNVGSIGAIAVAPSNSKTLYVGTGEADMRSSIANGNGMYKSTDGGKIWKHIGLDDSQQIGKIIVDPRDANTLYVAVLGHSYGPNSERGVFKSTDGGSSWSKVLFKDNDTGAIDLAFNPANPDVIYASLWQTRRPPWNVYAPSCGPGSGLYKSSDAGKTWTQLTNGIPKSACKIGLSTTAANPQRVYAEIDTPDVASGGIYRSDDAGASWTHTGGGKDQHRIWGRGWYFSGITADPKNADVLYIMNTATYRTDDGGKTFTALKGSPGGDDYHVMWINPNDSNILELAGDQGTSISVDRGNTWSTWLNQPTAQIYRVATDNAFPYNVYGAQQDSGAYTVPSQSIHQNINYLNMRPMDVGGESGSVQPDPDHPWHLIGTGFALTYEDLATGQERVVDPMVKYPDTDWRSTWTLPLEISPVDKAVYTSHQVIFQSHNMGKSWKIISPDLTRSENIDHLANLDAPTVADNNGEKRHGVVYALKPSPFDAAMLWAGTDDGKVWLTRDNGAHWRDITPKALTPWSKVAMIDASHFDKNTAYIAVDRHRLDDYMPNVYVTHNGGTSWSRISNGIPAGDSVNVVREDPKTRGLLYAGTERGIFISFDGGANWQSMQRNLPITSVRDITIHGDDVVIATHGRGFWIMDDIAPLRQHAATSGNENHLFAPPVTVRVHRAGGVGGGIADESTPIQPDEPQFPNPPLGMYIDYNVQSSAPVTIEIVDAGGRVVRKYASTDKAEAIDPNTQDIAPRWIPQPLVVPTDTGTHRFVWDFTTRHDGGPLAPPGHYTVRVTIGATTYSQPATLVRDPRGMGSDADLVAAYRFANDIEDVLAQIQAAMKKAKGNAKLAKALSTLSDQFTFLEGAVTSVDAAPTPDQRTAYDVLSAKLKKLLK